jgi:ketosteroid isomerase-like protein
MAHRNEEIARAGAEALSKGDMETFMSYQADDIVVHFPGRGPMAGDHRGKQALGELFQRQMEVLDGPPEIEIHDVLATDDHAVVLNNIRATVGGKPLDQRQVVVLHIENDKVVEAFLHFSDQQTMDEMVPA